MAIRSGRFKGDATGNGISVISGSTGAYRIFNSGEKPFDVYDDTTKIETVPEECSIDIRPGGTISIRTTAAGDVDGIYELLTTHGTVRSGRVKLTPATGTTAVQTILNEAKADGFYRIMNSGASGFAVERNSTAVLAELKPKMSIDIQVKQNNSLSITGASEIECIYFHLNQLAAVKSGRFKIDPNAPVLPKPDPAAAHAIINTDSQVDSYYRVFNSGAYSFEINVLGTKTTVAPGRSFDFNVDKKTTVNVNGLNSADAIEGIYDYLVE